MDNIVNKVLEIFQKIFLNSELTGEIVFPFLLIMLSSIGADKPKIDLQKESSKIFSVLNFLIYNYRQHTISGYHELLNTIPHLYDIIGPIDQDTRLHIQQIERKNLEDKNISENINIIGKYQIIIDNIFEVVERYLKISKNHPHILKSPEIHSFLKNILFESKKEAENVLEIEDDKISNMKKVNFYFDFDQGNNCLKIYFKIDGFDSFPSVIFNKDSFMMTRKNFGSPGKISELVYNIYNSKIKNEEDDNGEEEGGEQNDVNLETVRDKVKEILSNYRYKIGRQTRIFIGGHSLEGCLPIIMCLDPEIQNILCQSDVTGENVFVINIGTPSFCDDITRKNFLSLNYNYYHFVSMKDLVSFQKLEPWSHLGMPTILGNPKKVDEFFVKFFGNVFDSTKLKQDKNKKSDYIDEINKILKNQFDISDEYNNYEPQDEHNCFLSLPMNTNVSFDLRFKYRDNENTENGNKGKIERKVMTL